VYAPLVRDGLQLRRVEYYNADRTHGALATHAPDTWPAPAYEAGKGIAVPRRIPKHDRHKRS